MQPIKINLVYGGFLDHKEGTETAALINRLIHDGAIYVETEMLQGKVDPLEHAESYILPNNQREIEFSLMVDAMHIFNFDKADYPKPITLYREERNVKWSFPYYLFSKTLVCINIFPDKTIAYYEDGDDKTIQFLNIEEMNLTMVAV